jgi:hypothetical protein
MAGLTFFDSEAPDDGNESIDERLPIPGPPPGVGELKNFALPDCPRNGIFHVTRDRAEHRSDDFRLKARNFPSKELFAVTTYRPPQGRLKVIYGFMTQIRQVAAACTKDRKEILVVNFSIGILKCSTHSAIQTGVAGIKKASGSRR